MEVTEKKLRRNNVGLAILAGVLAIVVFGTMIAYFITAKNQAVYGSSLEDTYQRSFYNLSDDVNNAEIKLSKLAVSFDGDYQSNLIDEIVKNTTSAQQHLSVLPLSVDSFSSTTKFINQLGGYISTLQKDLDNGAELTSQQKEKLRELHMSIKDVKITLAEMDKQIQNGYSIIRATKLNDEGENDFTTDFKGSQTEAVEYPTMIYDGPFSDSVVDKEIKGLNFAEVTKDEAQANLEKLLEGQNYTNIKYASESNGKIVTYDFTYNLEGQSVYASMTKKGGKLLSISGANYGSAENIGLSEAKQIAKKFVDKMEIGTFEVVWSDVVGHDAYLNMAPVINNAIIYPDLIKVKIDLGKSLITGYDSRTYFTNHKSRVIPSASYGATDAQGKISSDYTIISKSLCVAPLDYNREVLCYEFKCLGEDSETYYFFINAQNGALENILKVIQTDNGSLLM